jgi:hypothetical protein
LTKCENCLIKHVKLAINTQATMILPGIYCPKAPQQHAAAAAAIRSNNMAGFVLIFLDYLQARLADSPSLFTHTCIYSDVLNPDKLKYKTHE